MPVLGVAESCAVPLALASGLRVIKNVAYIA